MEIKGMKREHLNKYSHPNGTKKMDTVQIQISLSKLESLFKKGELCAAEIRCLNCESKICIKDLCLATCAYENRPYTITLF